MMVQFDITKVEVVQSVTDSSAINGTHFSTKAADNSPGPSDADYAFVWIYVSPLILLTGIIGNVLTLCVMTRRRLSGTSTCVYLSAMAVADTLALLCRIPPEFFEACSPKLIFSEINRWTCKIEKFSFYTSSDAAIWILVVFTLDRLVAVCFPLLKHTLCAPRRAFLVCCLVVVLAVGKNFHVFWTRDIEYTKTGTVKRMCGRPEPYRYFENEVRPWLALTLVSVVPFVIIILSNSIIVRQLIRAHHVRHHSLAMHMPLSSSPVITNGNGNGRYNDSDGEVRVTSPSPMMGKSAIINQTSLMCLAVSLAFLVCVTPSIMLTIGREQWKTAAGYYIARAVTHQLSCVNHAINFFLYCITGQRFRDELVGLIRRRRSSSTTFDETHRQYYLTRRSTQFSAGMLVMQTLSMSTSVPVGDMAVESDSDKLDDLI